MKKLLFFFILAPLAAVAQEDSTGNHGKFIKVISIGGYTGGDIYRDGFEDRSVFQQAVPSSSLAYSDLTGFSNQSGYYMPYMMNAGNVSEGMFVNFRLRCQHQSGELRAGIVHSNVNVAQQFYYRSSTTTIDTTALPGGELLYTDSVNTAYYMYNWNSDMIGIHIGWIVRSSPRRLINLYTGLGAGIGFGFNGVYTAEYYNYSQKHYNSSSSSGGHINYYSSSEEIADIQEAYKAPGLVMYSVYLPVGLNWRLSRKQNFLGHTALFMEYQGAMQFIVPAGMNSKIRTSSTFAGGLRWYIHAPKTMRGEGRHRHHHHNWQNANGNQNPKVD